MSTTPTTASTTASTTPPDGSLPVALVTGAARGIGAAVARQLGAAGHHVVVTARDLDAASAVADEIATAGGSAAALTLDLDDDATIVAAATALGDAPLALLVNNAAAFADWSETASTADLAVARKVMDTNLFGTWSVVQAFLPALRRNGAARIVNLGSGSGSHGDERFGLHTGPSSASYAVSKAAVHALTAKLAADLASDGIVVDAVDPGLTATAPGMEAMGARPVDEGAASVVTAATRPIDGTTGTFTRDGAPLPW